MTELLQHWPLTFSTWMNGQRSRRMLLCVCLSTSGRRIPLFVITWLTAFTQSTPSAYFAGRTVYYSASRPCPWSVSRNDYCCRPPSAYLQRRTTCWHTNRQSVGKISWKAAYSRHSAAVHLIVVINVLRDIIFNIHFCADLLQWSPYSEKKWPFASLRPSWFTVSNAFQSTKKRSLTWQHFTSYNISVRENKNFMFFVQHTDYGTVSYFRL